MQYMIVSLVALAASGLTLFSGFGLGTLLMPAFALFFPLETAIALTAVVHLLNNLFKLVLVGRHADRSVLLRFGMPAMICAALGALALHGVSGISPIATYPAFGREAVITPVKLLIAGLMLAFAFLEASKAAERWGIPPRWLPLGGALSGFFGGLSGHQGALRSAFLLRAGLSKEAFIGTGVAIACLVDVGRLLTYGSSWRWDDVRSNVGLLTSATLSAFAGAWLGSQLLSKVTLRHVQMVVAVMLVIIAGGLASGLI